ncbi:MAG: hypothetical protein U5J63_09635 [Fodinibius sp.]|nr:hypothetical protein [Fodinibius sp.]
MNDAGVIAGEREETLDGIEETLADQSPGSISADEFTAGSSRKPLMPA